ncbi:MAG: molybdopterin cofactor-binding domain-containing protein, partial [Niameybacter sp.]
MSIGESVKRVDAYEKVTGRAKYTDDLCPKNALIAKVLHSTIANGWVKQMDCSEALKVPGVIKIVTCFDVPNYPFPTAGHPWSTDPKHQDVADRLLLNQRVRYYGDDIAAVIAVDEVAASRALEKIQVTYEILPPILHTDAPLTTDTVPLHEAYPDNILAHSDFEIGNYEESCTEEGLIWFEDHFDTQMVQHCHIEPATSFAYEENHRVIVVSSTQIPHIMRRIISQALGLPFGEIRVIKPYIGGGFGNKQDVLYEPLNAFLCTQAGGKCVKLELSREETFHCTRTRHAISFKLKTGVRPDGQIVTRYMEACSNQGAYTSHGHAIVSNAITGFRHIYQQEKAVKADAYTVFTNLPCGGAMRGYGIPQMTFACESHMQDIALKLGLDPIAFRLKNVLQLGYKDPFLGITCHSYGLQECIAKGRTYIDWDKKCKTYANQTGPIRRGVGMAIFSYKTGVYPISLETASARLILNQDGSVQLQMGATEIGQGADTVFSQMAAETIGLTLDH